MNDDSRTVWCGNLSDRVTEELLYELFLQVAPLERVKIPTDREGRRSNFAFVTMKHQISVDYAVQMLDGTALYEKKLNIKPRKAKDSPQFSTFDHNMMNFNALINMGQMMQVGFQQMGQGFEREDYKPYNRDKHYGRQDNNYRNNWQGRNNHQRNNHRNRRNRY